MKGKLLGLLTAACLAVAAVAPALQASERYFGYYADGATSGTHDHTNVTHIWASFADRNQATNTILHHLDAARANGIRAVVSVDSFLFRFANGGNGNYTAEPNAAQLWNGLMQTLVAHGHIVPGNPAAGTVLAFYPVDEPELHGLNDSFGSPHPALAAAIQVIRNHPHSANIPIAGISSKKYNQARAGLHLMDWVGLDNYSLGTWQYLDAFNAFKAAMRPGQRFILVPQASQGGMMGSYGSPHDPLIVFERFLEDASVVMLMPFLWDHPDTQGVRFLPSLREPYRQIGRHVAFGAPLPLRATPMCTLIMQSFFCEISIDRGTAPYSVLWEFPNGNRHGSNFSHQLSCGFHHEVRVTTIDAGGYMRTVNLTLYCPPGGGGLF